MMQYCCAPHGAYELEQIYGDSLKLDIKYGYIHTIGKREKNHLGDVIYKRKEGTKMDLLLVLLCITLFCVLCVVVWKYNHMNYTAKVVLIVCSLIVFVSFLKKYAFMRL